MERWIGYAPLNITYFHVFLLHDVDHASTNKQKACVFFVFFRSRDMTDIKIRKNTKVAIIFVKNKKEKKAGFPFVCAFGSNTYWYDVKISDRNSQN